MDKEQYFLQLDLQLQKLGPAERVELMDYYREYALDAELSSYDALVSALGTPKALAARLMAQSALKTLEGPQKKGSWRAMGMGILALCSLPLALPLGIAVLAIGFALLITVAALLLSAGLVFASGVLAGLWLLAKGCMFFTMGNLAGGAMAIGMGLVGGVVCIVMAHFLGKLVRVLLRVSMQAITKTLDRRKVA